MHSFSMDGPALTYVTDPALNMREQRRVVQRFMRCASNQNARVAFRLPDATDDEMRGLLEWYLRVVEHELAGTELLPPLIHNRPAVAARYEEAHLWMPARSIGDEPDTRAYSVHNLDEVMRALRAGAEEVIFGHVFASESHPDQPGRGADTLKQIVEIVLGDEGTSMVTAIGGITEQTIGRVANAGIGSVACIRAVSRSPDIPATLQEMRRNWQTHAPGKEQQ